MFNRVFERRGSKAKVEHAAYIYRVLCRSQEIRKTNFLELIKEKKYLLLSYFFERNIFASNPCSLDSIFILGLKDFRLSDELDNRLRVKERFAYLIGKLFCKRFNFKFRDCLILTLSIFRWLFSSILAQVDLMILIILCIFFSFYKSNCRSLEDTKIDEVYNIFYWKEKSIASPVYYYPDFNERKSKFAFATDFYGYRFLSKGLFDAFFINKIYTPLDFVRFSTVFNSVKSLVDLHLFELTVSSHFKYSSFISLFDSIQLINRRFLALITLNVSDYLLDTFQPKTVYTWHESQLHTKAFAIGINRAKSKHLDFINYSYIGTLYSKNYYPHYSPTEFDIKSGLWSNTILVHDQSSFIEMESVLPADLCLKIEIARNGLIRYPLKNLSLNIETPIKKIRDFTIITHDDPHELFVIIYTLILNYKKSINKIKFNGIFYIRLHPALSRQTAINQIRKVKKLFNINGIRFIFLDPANETIVETIKFSEFCIFGDSTYINLALLLNSRVISIRTTYLFSSPIFSQANNTKVISMT